MTTASLTDVVTVAAYAGPHRLGRLLPYLPLNWRLVRRDWLDDRAGAPDLVLIFDATGTAVAEARRRDPGAPVVVVLDPRGDQRDVIAVLHAGADACVRSDSAAIVAAHLQACRRRRYQAGQHGRCGDPATPPCLRPDVLGQNERREQWG
jgi:DNA-binding response OmpR family regulator